MTTPADPNVSGSKDLDPSNYAPTTDPETPATPAGDNTPNAFPAAGVGGDPDPEQPVTPIAGPSDDEERESGPSTTDMSGSIWSEADLSAGPSDPNHNAGDGGAAPDASPNVGPAPDHDPETPVAPSGANAPNWGGEGGPSSVT